MVVNTETISRRFTPEADVQTAQADVSNQNAPQQ